jgi:hypothetical protein
MKTYDFLKKRNIACWGSVLLLPLLLLLATLVSLIVLVATSTRDRPDIVYLPFVAVLIILVGAVFDFHSTIVVILVLAVPRYYHREKVI